jgi:TPR repeat protein
MHIIETNGDHKRVYELFKSSAQTGLDASQSNLSKCLEDGTGCETDVKESFKWLLRAAVSGEPEAQARVSRFYRLGAPGGVKKNDDKAFHFATLAWRKSIAGLFELGMCWMDRPDTDGKEKAICCFEKAAEMGYTMAMLRLGDYYYERAQEGAADEYDLAFEWMKKAAEQIEESKLLCLMFCR